MKEENKTLLETNSSEKDLGRLQLRVIKKPSIKLQCTVKTIKAEETYEWLLKKHYAKRIPSISYAFGLYVNDILEGVCTFGLPPNPNLCVGVCGEEFRHKVVELNRLCINENMENNVASFFVAKCLKMIEPPKIIISYADTSMHHIGYIYQATNFIYTGLSAKRTDPDHGTNNMHNRHSFVGGLPQKERPRKHRYVYFIGNKKQRKEMLGALNYKIEPYPKGANQRYECSYTPNVQQTLF